MPEPVTVNPEVVRYPAAAIRKAVGQLPTPFFLYEEAQIRANCRDFCSAFGSHFDGFTPLFAVKANPNPHVLKVVLDAGFGLDCSSRSEVWLARRLGAFGMHTGNYTSEEELRYVLESEKVLLNLDDLSLLDPVAKIGCPEFLSFRINLGISSADLESNLLAGPKAKFGVPLEQAVEAYSEARDAGASRFGIHVMTGSNVTDEGYFPTVAERLWEVVARIHAELGIDFEYMNIGGGFNVPYRPTEPSHSLDRIAEKVAAVFERQAAANGMEAPRLMVEPGRRILADAGFLVSRVTAVKDGYRRYAGLDASANDMPRPFIYGAYHHASVLDRETGVDDQPVTLVGSICENSDRFTDERLLPKLEVGDVVVLHNCGAHAHSMGFNYNGKLRHAEYLLREDGSLDEIRRSETLDDLFATVSGWPT